MDEQRRRNAMLHLWNQVDRRDHVAAQLQVQSLAQDFYGRFDGGLALKV